MTKGTAEIRVRDRVQVTEEYGLKAGVRGRVADIVGTFVKGVEPCALIYPDAGGAAWVPVSKLTVIRHDSASQRQRQPDHGFGCYGPCCM